VVFIAHNASFDRSRLQSIIDEILPNVTNQGTHFRWVDTLPLLDPVITARAHNGHIISKSSKLSTLVSYYLPTEDISRYNSFLFF